MKLSQLELSRADLNLHRRIYQWSAQQFDPGWVLDVGTELGVGIDLMQTFNPRLNYVGCDINLTPLRSSRSLAGDFNQKLMQADGGRLPLKKESLSGVCLINILHLVKEPNNLLKEIFRSLKHGGRVVVYIDLSKLPSNWEAEPLGQYMDGLLESHFECSTPVAAFRFLLEDLPSGDNLSKDIYLRLGEREGVMP